MKKSFTKRELRKLFRGVFYSAQRMSHLLHNNKEKETQLFIEDRALEYIMRIHTDLKFGKKSTPNNKYYNEIFNNNE